MNYTFSVSNFQKYLEPIEKYEALFKLLCHNPNEKKPFQIATLESLTEGIKIWFDGRDNFPLASMIFMYLGRGFKNHKVTLTEFIHFLRELTQVKQHQN